MSLGYLIYDIGSGILGALIYNLYYLEYGYDGTFAADGAAAWRTLDLPHDWAIEGEFSKENYIDSVREEAHLEFRHDSFLPRGCGCFRRKHLAGGWHQSR